MQLKGTFQITDWQESTDKSFNDGGKLTTTAVCQSYSGGITGSSEIKYQMIYSADGNASFVGYEFIEGNIENTPCRLTLKHDGCFEQGHAKSQFVVVNSSSHKELLGLSGNFESTEGGQANYVIE
jgi:hypothetical protein